MSNHAKEAILGNGALTLAARLMSAIGMPAAAVVLGWIGTEIWSELKLIRGQREATVQALATLDARVGGLERDNALFLRLMLARPREREEQR